MSRTGVRVVEQSVAPPGWYADQAGVVRWWDGSSWTAHVVPAASSAEEPQVGVTPTPASVGDILPGTSLGATTIPRTGRLPATRNVGAGVLLIAIGAAFLAAFAATVQLSSPHGGVVWVGAAMVGIAFILRGFGQFAREDSGTRQRLHGAAHHFADPRAAHREVKAAQKANRKTAAKPGGYVPTWIVVACMVSVVLFGLAIWFAPSIPNLGATDAPAAAAPAPAAKATTAAAAKAKAAATKPAPTGPYVPNEVDVWEPIGTNAAYSVMGMNPQDCLPGTSCAIVKIANRTSCAKLQVHVVFLTSTGTRSSSTTITLRRVRGGHAVRTRLTARDDSAVDYKIMSARCT